jgi:hypothetical protein
LIDPAEPTAAPDPIPDTTSELKATVDRLNSEIQRLRQRESELVTLLDTITQSKGWRALEKAKRIWLALRPGKIRPDQPRTHETVAAVLPQASSPANPTADLTDVSRRIDHLERQLELVEKHHVTGFWHTLDKIDELSASSRRPKCLICDYEDSREGFEILTSVCIFNGGLLERYRCPSCDCIFGTQKFLDLSDTMIDLDYRLLYSRYREGETGDMEKRTFHSLQPKYGGVYINWGSGAWNDTTTSLRDLGFDVWSYEPSARTNSPFVVTTKTAIAPNLAGIFSNNVIEHFKDPIAQFREFHSILAPGARMAHSTACYEYLYPFTRFHTVFLLGRSPKILAERTGFRIADQMRDGEYMNVVFEKI